MADFRATLDKLVDRRNRLYHNQWDTSKSHMLDQQLQELFTCVIKHLLGECSPDHRVVDKKQLPLDVAYCGCDLLCTVGVYTVKVVEKASSVSQWGVKSGSFPSEGGEGEGGQLKGGQGRSHV